MKIGEDRTPAVANLSPPPSALCLLPFAISTNRMRDLAYNRDNSRKQYTVDCKPNPATKMTITAPIRQLQLQPGSLIAIPDISWQEFEAVLAELDEGRSTRLAYSNKTLGIVSPLPKHERTIVIISDLVKILLRRQKRSWESLRSTTFKRQGFAGIEPDDCFYIQNYRAIRGKDRLDLDVDTPPDLAIESDITSKTSVDAYAAIQVPELWIYGNDKLNIKLFQHGNYVDFSTSPTFPDVPIPELVVSTLARAQEVGTSEALWEFEQGLDCSS